MCNTNQKTKGTDGTPKPMFEEASYHDANHDERSCIQADLETAESWRQRLNRAKIAKLSPCKTEAQHQYNKYPLYQLQTIIYFFVNGDTIHFQTQANLMYHILQEAHRA